MARRAPRVTFRKFILEFIYRVVLQPEAAFRYGEFFASSDMIQIHDAGRVFDTAIDAWEILCCGDHSPEAISSLLLVSPDSCARHREVVLVSACPFLPVVLAPIGVVLLTVGVWHGGRFYITKFVHGSAFTGRAVAVSREVGKRGQVGV